MWGGRLFLAPGMFLYVGAGASAERHAHHAVQFVWAKDGDVLLQLARGSARVKAGLVPANLEHTFGSSEQTVALLLVELHGPRGAALNQRANALVGQDLADRIAWLGFPSVDLTPEAALAWCETLLEALGSTALASPSRATRRAVEYIESTLESVPRLSEAAGLTGLSTTRLTHLFSKEMGIPFRRFVLWARIKRAVEASRRGANTTEAAVEAGFSDGAHLSRTFRAMFGLAPSMVLPVVEIVGERWAAPTTS